MKNRKKKNILLVGHGGSMNRGCEAIIRCTVDIIQRHLGSINIAVTSEHPDSDRIAFHGDLDIPIHDASPEWPKLKRYSLKWFINGVRYRLMKKPRYDLYLKRSLYRQSDIVIHIGGDNFCYPCEERWFDELSFARSLGAKTVIWAASINLFRQDREVKWAEELRKMDLITVRESETLKYLKKINVSENVRKVSDPAYLLPASSKGVHELNWKGGSEIIGIGMSDLISNYASSFEKYLDAFVQFSQWLLSNPDTILVLIPHVIYPDTGLNDLAVCRTLSKRLGDPGRVYVIDKGYVASQLKYIISQTNYFIGARTHSTLSSLSSMVPTLTIGYSTKAYGMNRDIFGHADYVVSVEKISGDVLINAFNLMKQRRREIVEHLGMVMPILRNEADYGGICLKAMLDNVH